MIGNVNAKPWHFWVWLYQSRNLRYCGGSSWTSVVRRTLDLRVRISPQVALVTLEYFSTWELEPYLRLWAFKVSMVYGRTPDNYTNCRRQIRTPLGKFWEKVGCQNPDKVIQNLQNVVEKSMSYFPGLLNHLLTATLRLGTRIPHADVGVFYFLLGQYKSMIATMTGGSIQVSG